MRINYLSWLAKEVGCSSEERQIPSNIITISELLDYLENLGSGYKNAFKSRKVVFAEISGKIIGHNEKVSDCEEITLFGPVVGG